MKPLLPIKIPAVDKAPHPSTPESQANTINHAALYRLMTWLSPSFPVGAFSWSSGIEWAIEAGDVHDAQTLRAWLTSLLIDGAGFCDGLFLAHAWRACATADDGALADVAELAAAFSPTRERYLEATAQGQAFMEIARTTWSCPAIERMPSVYSGAITYPIAVGVLSAGHDVALDLTMHAFLHAQTANWISAGVRLVPLGQTDSQRILAALEPVAAQTADRALRGSLDDLASSTFRADLASMHHESQYTRLFRS